MKNIHSVSIKGLRDQNEDKHDIIINCNNNDPYLNNVNYFAVYDGHGGKQVSEYIQENLSKYFINKKTVYPLSKKFIINVCDKIQRDLSKYNYSYYSGTTCVAAIQFKKGDDTYLNIFNIGDSRCIICRDNFALPLTKDHKPHWPEERSRIEKLGGRIFFDGYDFRIKDLSVSRAFGDLDASPFVTHRPDIFRYKLDKNDKFIVLACDGVWDVLTNDDVVNFILLSCYDDTTKNRINLDINIAKKLTDYALKKGSTDNITVIIVFL